MTLRNGFLAVLTLALLVWTLAATLAAYWEGEAEHLGPSYFGAAGPP